MLARKYQAAAIAFSVAALSEHRRAVIQLPTGTGKSLVLLLVAASWLSAGKPVYIIAPTEQAVSQIYQLARLLNLFVCLDTKDNEASCAARAVVTTYACAWRRYKRRITPRTLCLLDECHHVNYEAPVNAVVLNAFQAAIGFSATPWSKGCLGFFDKNQYTYKLSQAISDGYACEYDVAPWESPARGRYQIVYTNNEGYRIELCQSIPESDYAIYSRSTSKQVIARFRNGLVGTIVVNRMLTEGFDLPQIKRVWIERDIVSRISIMQMAGRALRPFKAQRAIIRVKDDSLYTLLNNALSKAG